jgi:hypothetical protein
MTTESDCRMRDSQAYLETDGTALITSIGRAVSALSQEEIPEAVMKARSSQASTLAGAAGPRDGGPGR